jgi:predicted nucleic-acid-binding Zn-ribbon protein
LKGRIGMSEIKICPKCGGEMEKGARITSATRGWIPHAVTLAKEGDLFGDKILPFYCKRCGFIELFKEMKDEKGYAELFKEMIGKKE